FAGALAEGMPALIDEGLEHIEAFQHCGRMPEECAAFARGWAGRAPDPETDEAAREADRVRCERFSRFVRLYELFTAECRRTGQVNYEDLILLSIVLLREHPQAAAVCRADYTHIVVDEFQDVNAGQIELLRLLCPPVREGRRG